MEAEARMKDLKNQALSLVLGLTRWTYAGEESRASLHTLGAELQDVTDRVAAIWKEIQFPSFAAGDPAASAETQRASLVRRRDLVVLATSLSPSNIDILEWLGERDDKEAAYLYAFARGSVSEKSEGARTAFYDSLESIIQRDPVLVEARGVEVVLEAARRQFSRCQAEAYENMK